LASLRRLFVDTDENREGGKAMGIFSNGADMGQLMETIVMIGTFVAAALAILVIVLKRKDLRALKKTRFDQGSTPAVLAVFALSLLLIAISPLLNHFHVGAIGGLAIRIAGLAMAVLGMSLRFAAGAALKRFFTPTLQQTDHHQLVTTGVYSVLRHPGYAGNILFLSGVAFAMGNLVPVLFVPAAFIAVYLYRINREEKMLIEIFGEAYRDYQKKVKRLIPFIW